MMTYIKLGKVRGLFIELKKDFGTRPFFRKNTFHHETIVDIPYVQIIYTSGKWRPKRKIVIAHKSGVKKIAIRRASNVNKQTHHKSRRKQADENSQGSGRIYKY